MSKRLVGRAPRLCEQRCLRAQAGLLSRPLSTLQASSSVEATLRRFGVQRVRPWLASALHRAGFVEPLPVQGAAMERVAKHEDVVIHAETGTGKTLAYLVPTLSRLKPGVPLQLLILLPSRELALQVASEVHRLLAVDAPLHVALAVGGTSVAAGVVAGGSDEALTRASAQLQAQRSLADEVSAGRAEVLVGTPHAVRRVLHTGVRDARKHASDFDFSDSQGISSQLSFGKRRVGANDYFGLQQGGSDGAKLLLTIASNLEAIVLDEVDALLPKPQLSRRADRTTQQMAFYRQVDWARLSRNERLAHRPGGSLSAPAAKLVSQLLASVSAVRGPNPDEEAGERSARVGREAERRMRSAERRRQQESERKAARRADRVQLVGASATVGRNTIQQLRYLFKLNRPPAVIGARGGVSDDGRSGGEASPTAVAIAQLRREGKRTTSAAVRAGARSHGSRGVAGVQVPRSIIHRSLTVPDDAEQPRALHFALDTIRPRSALVVVPDEAPLRGWLERLHEAGLPQARLLHEAMGFPSRGSVATDLPDAELLASYGGGRPLTAAGAEEDVTDASQTAVLLTTERSVRGLDLPHLDCVALMYVPKTSDDYVHLAGRTGRNHLSRSDASSGAGSGTALTLVPAEEAGRLGLFTVQLGVSIKPMSPPPWLAYGIAQQEAQTREAAAARAAAAKEARAEELQAAEEAEALVAAMADVEPRG